MLKVTTLRLRETTVAMLKQELASSSHRSMATLADEILAAELAKRLDAKDTDVDRLIRAAGRTA
jgi:hypothetical protein